MNPKNYKAQGVPQIAYGMALFFAAIITLWIMTLIFPLGIFPALKAQPEFGSNPFVANALNNAAGAFTGLNNVLAFMFIFFCIISIAAAALTDSHPVFAVIGIMLMPVEIIIAFGLHDAFFSMISNSAFTPLVTAYPYTVYMFQFLPIIVFAADIIIVIVTFSKS
jgi:hypothetical protein